MAALLHRTNAVLTRLGYPVADALDLPELPPHFPTLVYAFLGWYCLHLFISPVLSRVFFPETYGKLKTRRQINNWNIQVVSFLHVFVVVPLAARCLTSENLNNDKAYGWDEKLGTMLAVSCAYFLWDCVDAVMNFDDLGFFIHGFSCFTIYLGIFRPFLGHYAARFLSWELSTIFLNVHRFLDRTGRTGTTAQAVNGALLLATFFGVRICWGWYETLKLYMTLWGVYNSGNLSVGKIVTYVGGSWALHGLNAMWMYKMVLALKKRFDGSDSKPRVHPDISTKVNGNPNGIANGIANGVAHDKAE